MMHWEDKHYQFIHMDNISQQSLAINYLGLETRKNDYYIDNSNREWYGYVFQYTLEGYGFYETQGIKYNLSKGKAFFITIPEDCKFYVAPAVSSDYHWTFFFIHFSGPAVEPFFNRIRELKGPVIEVDMDSVCISLFFELYELICSNKPLGHYYGSEWLYRFLISLLRNVEFPPKRITNPHVITVMEWIKKNYKKQIILEDISHEIGVTYAHLTREFSKEQGISPVQYLTHIRLESAIQLLLNTDLSINIIAEECGFSCANYFTKVFKKVLHITPCGYRKQHKICKDKNLID